MNNFDTHNLIFLKERREKIAPHSKILNVTFNLHIRESTTQIHNARH